jgi:molecular chaperone IbpA
MPSGSRILTCLQKEKAMTITRISPLLHHTLGFDRFFDDIEKLLSATPAQHAGNTFPYHNIIRVDDNRYIIELAVAGFSKDDIEITREKNTLVIKGNKEDGEMGQAEYLHRGIAARNFTKTITIADTIEVHSSELKDGILRVGLINVIPEHQKPKRIEIGNELKFFEPKLLQEEKKAA